jgi:hypothetical protein
MMVVMDFTGCHKARDSILVASSVTEHFSAFADALIRLNVRTSRDFLQKYLNRFCASLAFESQEACGCIGHDFFLNKLKSCKLYR